MNPRAIHSHSWRHAAVAAATGLLLIAPAALAQTGTHTSSHKEPVASSGSLSASDQKFLREAAQGGMMEVELGKLAADKASSDDVKSFGQRMVDDHTKANDQLKTLASNKSFTLPTGMSHEQRNMKDKLSKLSGAAFDRMYMDHMVKDHKQDVAEFKKESQNAKDSDVRSFASETLPTLQEHLTLAQQVDQKVSPTKSASMKHTSKGTSKHTATHGRS
jgi:putative membrane protein